MDLDERTGSSLRQELETHLARNVALEAELHSMKVEKALAAKGYEFVSPDDLKGVPLDKVEQKAQEIEDAKRADSEKLLRKVLEKRGLDEDEIQAFLDDQRPANDDHDLEQAHSRLRSLQSTESTPTRPKPVGEGLEARDAILAHFEDQERKTARSRGRRP